MQGQLLSQELVDRLRAIALEQVAVMDELEAALAADDIPRVMKLARKLCGLEWEVRE